LNGRAWLGLALLFSCAPELDDTGVTEATRRMVRATRVGVDNADQLLLSGLRADGLPGDYALTNDSLTAIIDATGLDEDRDRPEQRHRGSSGGTLIDLAPPGGRDALPQVLQLVGFDPQLRVHYQSVTVEEGGKAIHAVGRILDPERKIGVALDEHDLIEQVVVSTTWRMWDHQPWVQVETQVANQTSRPVELDPIVDLFVTDGQGAVPFVPSPGVGYDLPEGRTVLCPWLVLDADPGLPGAFAVLALEDGSLAVMAERDLDGRVRGVFVGKEDRAKDAIAPGDQRSWTRRYTASPGQDMTGVVRNVLELLGQQAGSYYLELGLSEGSDVRLDLGRSRQARATFHRLDPARYLDQEGRIRDGGVLPMATAWVGEGEATLETWLSLGRYAVEIESAGYRGEPRELEVQAELEEYGALALGEEALDTVQLRMVRADGQPNERPVRITVLGLGGTPQPELGRWQLAGEALSAGRRIWTDAGAVELRLPEGSYRLHVSQGPRYPLSTVELRTPLSEEITLSLPEAVIDGAGFVEADPFTASQGSIFGGDEAEDIAFALCGEGLELAVRAEAGGGEDAVSGCDGLQGVTGALATLDVPRTGVAGGDGWMVGFPVETSLPAAVMRPGAWLDEAWESGATITTVLAPRARGAAGAAAGMLHARGFERDRIDDGEANRFLRETSELGTGALDGGSLELISARDPWHSATVLQDWLALRQAGYDLFPVAASHSSWLEHDLPGGARTLILTDAEGLEERLEAFAQGRTVATSGPVLGVTLRCGGAQVGPGETLAVARGVDCTLDVHLQAASWVPVDRLRVFQDGQEFWSTAVEQDGELDALYSLPLLASSSWFVVDAGRPDVQPEGDYADVYPGMPVYAVTAAIVLDTATAR
jgi:hypothetical protein